MTHEPYLVLTELGEFYAKAPACLGGKWHSHSNPDETFDSISDLTVTLGRVQVVELSDVFVDRNGAWRVAP